MVGSGFEPRAAGWKVQRNQLKNLLPPNLHFGSFTVNQTCKFVHLKLNCYHIQTSTSVILSCANFTWFYFC